MEEIISQCVANLRLQAQEAGLDSSQYSDDEIWFMWWEACNKANQEDLANITKDS